MLYDRSIDRSVLSGRTADDRWPGKSVRDWPRRGDDSLGVRKPEQCVRVSVCACSAVTSEAEADDAQSVGLDGGADTALPSTGTFHLGSSDCGENNYDHCKAGTRLFLQFIRHARAVTKISGSVQLFLWQTRGPIEREILAVIDSAIRSSIRASRWRSQCGKGFSIVNYGRRYQTWASPCSVNHVLLSG